MNDYTCVLLRTRDDSPFLTIANCYGTERFYNLATDGSLADIYYYKYDNNKITGNLAEISGNLTVNPYYYACASLKDDTIVLTFNNDSQSTNLSAAISFFTYQIKIGKVIIDYTKVRFRFISNGNPREIHFSFLAVFLVIKQTQ